MRARKSVSAPTAENTPGLPQRRANIACISCRDSRVRCSGTAPCDSCLSSGKECIVDKICGGRRRRQRSPRRNVNEFRHFKWVLEGILICLRYSEGNELVELLQRVKDESPLPSLATSILSTLSLTEIPEVAHNMAAEVKLELENFIHAVCNPAGRDPKGSIKQSKPAILHNFDGESFSYSPSLAGGSEPSSLRQHFKHEAGNPRTPDAILKHIPESSGCMSSECEAMPTHGRKGQMRAAPGLNDILQFLKEPQNPGGSQGTADEGYGPNESQAMKSESVAQALLSLASEMEADVPESVNQDHNAFFADGYMQFDCSNYQALEQPNSTALSTNDQNMYSCIPADASELQLLSGTSATLNGCYDMSPSIGTGPHQWTDVSQPVHWPTSYMALPRLGVSKGYEAGAITDYLKLARTRGYQGYPIDEIFGPEWPYVDLLFRPRTQSESHSACDFASALCAQLKGMEQASKLGISAMFTYLIRWMILPSQENYQKIPHLYRPTPAEMAIPHSAEIGLCPFPRLRDALCHKNRIFLPTLASTISCNWPNEPSECCMEIIDETGPHFVLTEAFTRHIMQPENWTIGSDIFDTFPECLGSFDAVG